MTELASCSTHEVFAAETGAFFAPVSADVVDGLIGQYQQMRERIERIGERIATDTVAVGFYIDGWKETLRAHAHTDPTELFDPKIAIAALNASYWRRAMDMTDIYNAMPQARRDEWNEAIRSHSTPDFTEDAVRGTLLDLLERRPHFFAERVDGIFRALSHTHLTNNPVGFGKRMILADVFSQYGWAGGSRSGTINDLRCIIAKFMGNDEPRWDVTRNDLEACRRMGTGQWHPLDGGALRVRVYIKGTAHLEIHPDMAWRLNAILHTLYPTAIPASARTAPTKPPKAFAMMQRPLPFETRAILREARWEANGALHLSAYGVSAAAMKDARRVLALLGGVIQGDRVRFAYPARDVIAEVVTSGCVPDRMAHQFYPTPEVIATEAVALAVIGEAHTCLEPSAGLGGIARLLPPERTTCVEISPLHCTALRAQDLNTVEADFLQWARTAERVDRIVMNPPFSEGRARAHVEAAWHCLAPGGRMVAIVPASYRNKTLVPGVNHHWGEVIEGGFEGTSMAVALLALDKPL